MLTLTGECKFGVRVLGPDTTFRGGTLRGTKMQAAEFVLDGAVIPCVVNKIMYGSFEKLDWQVQDNVNIMFYTAGHETPHTREGFMSMQVTTKPVQFSAYLHSDHLEKFFSSFSMAVLRASLKK